MKHLLLLLFFTFAPITEGYFDYNGKIEARSYPSIGGKTHFQGGYSLLLWGDFPKANSVTPDFKYGFIRPSLTLSSSGVINGYKAQIEVFPISIFGIKAGKIKENVNISLDYFSCETIACQGDIDRTFLSFSGVLGFKGYFNTWEWKREKFDPEVDDKQFGDYVNVLKASPGKDYLEKLTTITGKRLGNITIGLFGSWAKYQNSSEDSKMYLGIYKHEIDSLDLTMGAGSFESDTEGPGFITVFRLVWNGIRSPKLVE